MLKNPLKIAFFLIFTVVLFSCNNQESMKKLIEKQFTDMSTAFLEGNLPLYVDYMYPKVIERAGGKDSTIKMLHKLLVNLNSQGSKIKSINYGNISDIVDAGTEKHCIVTQTLEISQTDGTQVLETSVLAVSADKGKTWKFLDVSSVDIKTIKQLFPEFNDALIIPEKKAPTFIPNNMQQHP